MGGIQIMSMSTKALLSKILILSILVLAVCFRLLPEKKRSSQSNEWLCSNCCEVSDPSQDERDQENAQIELYSIYMGLVAALERGLSPESEEAQALIARHYHGLKRASGPSRWKITRSVYIGLSQFYAGPNRDEFDDLHEDLAPFTIKAMQFYANKNLDE